MREECQSQLSESELRPGLVLFLLPSYLEHVGASSNVCWPDAVKGEHYFILLRNDLEDSLWVPTSSKPRFDRHILESGDKSGYPCWKERTSYCDPRQIWTIPNSVLGGSMFTDRTTPERRNGVRADALNTLQHDAVSHFQDRERLGRRPSTTTRRSSASQQHRDRRPKQSTEGHKHPALKRPPFDLSKCRSCGDRSMPLEGLCYRCLG